MPVYSFVCPNCGLTKEISLHIQSRNKKQICKKCGERMRRKLSAPAFLLKGSGWYVTDYKDKK